ncbi:hypothetical protein SKAU_G00065030 [Synaphobranchus kaupii]|uniref:Uncharacterized protein n=1 Tax=Synaphobranchus kaupii TaxID=118154 RepID=A0A9Q1G5L0_SYNKA|nr:hypothetical protein SKAU_G00065030 [Synaphobranchus kaupii]
MVKEVYALVRRALPVGPTDDTRRKLEEEAWRWVQRSWRVIQEHYELCIKDWKGQTGSFDMDRWEESWEVAVGWLSQLSDQDRDELQQHIAEECEAEVNRLVQLVQDPSPETLTVQETVGCLFMLYHRQVGLEIKTLRAEIKVLSRSNERLNSEVHDLCHDLKRAIGALEECTSRLDE